MFSNMDVSGWHNDSPVLHIIGSLVAGKMVTLMGANVPRVFWPETTQNIDQFTDEKIVKPLTKLFTGAHQHNGRMEEKELAFTISS
jgi:hypothetical protein